MKEFFNKNGKKIIGVIILIIFIGVICFFAYKKQTPATINPAVKISDYKSIDLSSVTEEDNVQDVILLDLLDKSEVPAPSEEDINEYVDALDDFYTEYADELGIDKETFIAEYVGIDNFDEVARENAIQYLNSKVILEEIANREKIEFTDEDYDKYLETLIDGTVFDSVEAYKEQIEIYGETEDMREAAYFDKILNYIYDLNK